MELVITKNHPILVLPFTYEYNAFTDSYFIYAFFIGKYRELIKVNNKRREDNIERIENEINKELASWKVEVDKLNSYDSDYYFKSIVPSIDLITKRIEMLEEKIDEEIVLSNKYKESMHLYSSNKHEKNLTIFLKQRDLLFLAEKEMRNTIPSFEQATSEHVRIERTLERIVEKQINYADCLELYKSDPEAFLENVVDTIPKFIVAHKNASQWIRNLDEKGVIKHLRTLPEFHNQNTALAEFLVENFNLVVSNDTLRKAIERLDK